MFHFLDFISPKITLYYKGELQHTSIPSILISILSVISIIVFSIIFSLDFILKRNPIGFYFKRPIIDIPKIPFNSNGLFHFITFNEDNIVSEKIDNHMIAIIGSYNNHGYLYDIKFNRTKYDHWIYGECDENDIKDQIQTLKENQHVFKYGFCIKKFYNSTLKTFYDKNDDGFYYPYLQISSNEENFEHYGLLIQKCENNSYDDNNFNCESDEEISKYIKKSVGYNIYFLDNSIFIDDYKNPFHYKFSKVSNYFNEKAFTINHLNFNAELLKTHKGIFLDTIEEQSNYVYTLNEKLTTETDSISNIVLGGAYFHIQNVEEVNERKYKLFQDIIASINGIAKIIIVIAKCINFFIHNYYYLDELNKNINFYQKNFENLSLKKKIFNIDSTINLKNDNSENKIHKFLNNNYLKSNNSLDSPSKGLNNLVKKKYFNSSKTTDKLQGIKFKIISDIIIPKYKISDLSCHDFLIYKFCPKKFVDEGKISKKLDKFRKQIISEECIFGIFYVIKTIQKHLNNIGNK
jgi:hypothetical protein